MIGSWLLRRQAKLFIIDATKIAVKARRSPFRCRRFPFLLLCPHRKMIPFWGRVKNSDPGDHRFKSILSLNHLIIGVANFDLAHAHINIIRCSLKKPWFRIGVGHFVSSLGGQLWGDQTKEHDPRSLFLGYGPWKLTSSWRKLTNEPVDYQLIMNRFFGWLHGGQAGLGKRINMIMQTVFFKLSALKKSWGHEMPIFGRHCSWSLWIALMVTHTHRELIDCILLHWPLGRRLSKMKIPESSELRAVWVRVTIIYSIWGFP